MTVIDIGAAATDRPSGLGNDTFIALDNPANADGIIDTIEVWTAKNIADLKVGTFYLISGTDYKCRDSVTIGRVVYGAKRTFSELSLVVKAGDYIGFFTAVSGALERDTSGYAGVYYTAGDKADPDDQATYSLLAGDTVSLYGTGVTIVTHEWEGSDGIAIGEALVKTPMKTLVDGIKFSDVVVKEFYKTLTDPIAFTDTVVSVYTHVRTFIDGIAFTDVVSKMVSKILSDGIKFRDILYKWRWLVPTRLLQPTRTLPPTRTLKPKG